MQVVLGRGIVKEMAWFHFSNAETFKSKLYCGRNVL